MLSRICYGEYLNPDFWNSSIYSYKKLYEEYSKKDFMFDESYICGYLHAIEFIYYAYNQIFKGNELEPDDTICLYYLPKNKLYNDFKKFNKDIEIFKVKKYINIANQILKNFENEDFEYEIHHLPFL